MKTADKVASKFIEARGIKADYGDTHMFFNIFDYLQPIGGGKMTQEQIKEATQMMETATSMSFKIVDRAVKTALRKIRTKVNDAGLEIK